VDRSPSSRPDPNAATAAPAAGPVVLLALFDIRPDARLWGWSRFVTGTGALRATPGLRFAKLLGSGAGGSFGLKPSASIQGLFCVFDDDAAADAFAHARGALQAWRDRARECFTVRLRAFSSRGTWSGTALATAAAPPTAGPVAALTRASIRPSRMAAFWRMQPAAERSLHEAPGCRLAIGLGEAPLLRQATFTVWDSIAAMDAYARHGAHQAAIRASAAGGFFSESMFVRFVPYDARGRWQGRGLA
jgi:spheroidene monooxygenase